ncbi:MAG TPA: hypothetical protein PK299_08670 [Anaerolineales bacterium]|nr:hypothetical protein [Anaerolineales bacterium]
MQHFNVKVFAVQDFDLTPYVGVFNGWIQKQIAPELLIDVADYLHVPSGPGMLLIGHEANYSLDQTDGKLGLLYNRKAVLPGSAPENLTQALNSALWACEQLSQETGVQFDKSHYQVLVNDRLLAPNSEQTFQALLPDLQAVFAKHFGHSHFTIAQTSPDVRKRFRVDVRLNN